MDGEMEGGMEVERGNNRHTGASHTITIHINNNTNNNDNNIVNSNDNRNNDTTIIIPISIVNSLTCQWCQRCRRHGQ